MKHNHTAFRAFIICSSAIVLILTAIVAANAKVTVLGPGEKDLPPPPKEEPKPEKAFPIVTSPIGSVTAWLKNIEGTPELPEEWVECNGQELNMPDSPYHKKVIPNLNGTDKKPKRFLRGSSESGAVGGSSSHNHSLIIMPREGRRTINVQAGYHANHLPDFYEVVWIMRVK